MKLRPTDLLWICTLLHLLLLSDYGWGSPLQPGGTVTRKCPGINPGDSIKIVIWRKENGSHTLIFTFLNQSANSTGWSVSNNTSTPTHPVYNNFTDPRISFLSPELPLTLQIHNAQPSDSANYSCTVTTGRAGVNATFWPIHVSDGKSDTIEKNPERHILPTLVGGTGCCVAALLILLWILHWKKQRSHNVTPRAIPQSFLEIPENPQVVYENPEECYYNRFNTLYDGLPKAR